MEQFYAYIDAIKQLDKNSNPKEVTKRLDELWTKLYLYEKVSRQKIINSINRYPNFTLAYEIEDLFTQLDDLPFYFFDVEPKINSSILSIPDLQMLKNKKLNEHQIKLILNTIVTTGRKYLIDEKKVNIKRDSLKNLCIPSSEYLYFKYRHFLNIYVLRTDNIFTDCFPHQFCVIELESNKGVKRYIIDLTYRQFCVISKCNDLRIYNIYDNYIMPGYFFKDKGELKNLLVNGYLEINESTAKLYGDSFILAGLNEENIKKRII